MGTPLLTCRRPCSPKLVVHRPKLVAHPPKPHKRPFIHEQDLTLVDPHRNSESQTCATQPLTSRKLAITAYELEFFLDFPRGNGYHILCTVRSTSWGWWFGHNGARYLWISYNNCGTPSAIRQRIDAEPRSPLASPVPHLFGKTSSFRV